MNFFWRFGYSGTEVDDSEQQQAPWYVAFNMIALQINIMAVLRLLYHVRNRYLACREGGDSMARGKNVWFSSSVDERPVMLAYGTRMNVCLDGLMFLGILSVLLGVEFL